MTGKIRLHSALLDVIVCPITKKSLIYDHDNQELISVEAGLAYPIIDGVPILLVEKARKIIHRQDIPNPEE